MPTICSFYGIFIRMYFNDHEPAHFHVEYAEFKATVSIEDLRMRTGQLPRRAEQLVLDWAEMHQAELIQNWQLCKMKQAPLAIAPLN